MASPAFYTDPATYPNMVFKDLDRITPTDPRITYQNQTLNGVNYNYLTSVPEGGNFSDTIFLVHGWPDLSLGWRHQIPMLTGLGLRVVAMDYIGYGGTDAPISTEFYTFKRAGEDMAALAIILGLTSIILGGHDWGGAIVYRMAIRFPQLIKAFFTIATPFLPPDMVFVDRAFALPGFAYQQQLRGGQVDARIVGEKATRDFLNGIYLASNPEGEETFTVYDGVLWDKFNRIRENPLMLTEEMDFYTKSYLNSGLSLNWYRTQELNFRDELDLLPQFEQGFQFEVPALFIATERDPSLPPSLSVGMDVYFKDLTRGEVASSHWANWEQPVNVNKYIKDFLLEKVPGLIGSNNMTASKLKC